ncbi:Panacea domain-containing protein [Caulobacter rhizosphaerae]|jgi:uncharacterized phage-associated protein|nr:type II toxin-antitoxin system antitoxin SocA domain-containing protein [Caulobacter rhizosphaerae]
MKLQKLVYYAYGWWLAYQPEPLLTEGPELWKHGPVFSSLYRTLASSRSAGIIEPQKAVPFSLPPTVPEADDQAIGLIDWIWGKYGQFGSFKLSDMTHAKGTPWQIEAEKNNYRVPMHHKIPDGLISDCFKKEAEALDN